MNLERYFRGNDCMSPWFNDVLVTPFKEWEAEANFLPAVDIHESKDAYVLDVDLPGMEEKDIKLEYNEGVLTLSGERTYEHEVQEGDVHRKERAFGSFKRSFTVGKNINPTDIKASFKNGSLKVTLPKIEAAKSQTIQIDVK